MTLEDEIAEINKVRGGLVGMAFEIMLKNIGDKTQPIEDRKRTYNTARNWIDNIPGNYPILKEEIEKRYKGEYK